MYSSIKKKTCKCGCGKMPSMSCNGFNYNCISPELKEKLGTRNQLARKNRSKRLAQGRKLHQAQDEVKTASGELMRWFNDRHKELSGYCHHCGGKTQKGAANFINSIHHILPKSLFPSVKCHPDNFLELCYYGKSCHANVENHMIDLIDLNCFDEVVTKFVKIYPHIAPQERRRIPEVLLQYLEAEK